MKHPTYLTAALSCQYGSSEAEQRIEPRQKLGIFACQTTLHHANLLMKMVHLPCVKDDCRKIFLSLEIYTIFANIFLQSSMGYSFWKNNEGEYLEYGIPFLLKIKKYIKSCAKKSQSILFLTLSPEKVLHEICGSFLSFIIIFFKLVLSRCTEIITPIIAS